MRTRVFSVIALLFILGAPFVFAVTVNTSIPGGSRNIADPAEGVCNIVFNFYDFAMALGGVLALGAITYGGVKYTMAAGNPSGQSEGKAWIKDALLGLLLLAGAYLILNIINPDLTKCGLPELTPVGTAPVVPVTTNPCSGVLTCGGGDGTCGGACPLDTNGDTQACRLTGGTLQKQCVPSAAGVRCGGATNGSCPTGQSCVGRGGQYSCVDTSSGEYDCGVPSNNWGSCPPVGARTQECFNTGGNTVDTARYSCRLR